MTKHVIIVGGGLAGLSAGAYARASGFETTIVEHNLALGGVCTAWPRGAYTVDGCIHWLTGGPFLRLYEELGIVPAVELRTLEHWATWRDAQDGTTVSITRDFDALARDLHALGPDDASEIARVLQMAGRFPEMTPPGIEQPPELATVREQLASLWEMRASLGILAHFRKPIDVWAREHIHSEALRRFFVGLVPAEAPALLLGMIFGYLKRGYLSRPVGGTARFRDALIGSYQRLGGKAILHATVDEILVDDGRAQGVRLADGTILTADAVISTSSTPETVLRLLGGRFDDEPTRDRLARWKLFDPIVLASFGVAAPYARTPSLLTIDGIKPFDVGGRSVSSLSVRVCNDDPCFAPPGHTVIQAMLPTDYEWWVSRGTRYHEEKAAVAEATLTALEPHFPQLRSVVRMTDLATPLTYWGRTRSWRGAYEGWMPNAESLFGHVKKTLSGLDGFYMAGQWVEPGGGVPMAVMSGRQAIQLICKDAARPFVASTRRS